MNLEEMDHEIWVNEGRHATEQEERDFDDEHWRRFGSHLDED